MHKLRVVLFSPKLTGVAKLIIIIIFRIQLEEKAGWETVVNAVASGAHGPNHLLKAYPESRQLNPTLFSICNCNVYINIMLCSVYSYCY